MCQFTLTIKQKTVALNFVYFSHLLFSIENHIEILPRLLQYQFIYAKKNVIF